MFGAVKPGFQNLPSRNTYL